MLQQCTEVRWPLVSTDVDTYILSQGSTAHAEDSSPKQNNKRKWTIGSQLYMKTLPKMRQDVCHSKSPLPPTTVRVISCEYHTFTRYNLTNEKCWVAPTGFCEYPCRGLAVHDKNHADSHIECSPHLRIFNVSNLWWRDINQMECPERNNKSVGLSFFRTLSPHILAISTH